jgi:solute:Na+ symporter, SSS family
MTLVDWLVLIVYIGAIVLIGIWFSRKAANSTADYFVAGRKLGWFVAGTSMVATTFSADTPLFVAGLTRSVGIFENWFWWCLAIGQIISVFFFARLWRRTEVVTDIEFITLRYDHGKAVNFLRIFKALYDGLFINALTLAVVLLSITKIVKVLVPYTETIYLSSIIPGGINTSFLIMFVLSICPLLFTVVAGLHGVVTAEVMQFILAMFVSITLACIIYFNLNSGPGLMENLQQASGFKQELLRFAPEIGTWNLHSVSFIILITIGWWSFAPSNGYFVQRMLASKSERDSLFGLLWFNIAHYILRPWPWIIVGIASLVYFPELKDSESAYPFMVNHFLPIGLKGLMVASLFAAFMSTTDTHLNWGTSYLINDVYAPFIKPGQSNQHYLRIGKFLMAGLTLSTLFISTRLNSILDTFQYIYAIMGGVSLVMLLRWYWWRVNVYAELTALAISFTVATILHFNPDLVAYIIVDQLHLATTIAGQDTYPVRLLINTLITSVCWIGVAILTNPSPQGQAIAFYNKMKISGPGWNRVRKVSGVNPIEGEFIQNLQATITCLVFLYSLLMAIGKLVFQDYGTGFILLGITLLAAFNLRRVMKQMVF